MAAPVDELTHGEINLGSWACGVCDRATLSGGGNTERSWSCRGHRNADSEDVTVTTWGFIAHVNGVTDHGGDQVQRMVPMDGLHVHTADGLEKLAVQLPFISGAYCADPSPEFGLWNSLWRRSDAKAATNTGVQKSFPLPFGLGNLSCCCQTRQQRSKDCPNCRHEFRVKIIRISSEDNEPVLGTK